MTQIDHNTQSVHLANHLLAKSAHATMGLRTTGRVADIIIAIMTKGDIHDATVLEMLDIVDVAIECQTILDTHHDTLASGTLIVPQLLRRTGKRQIIGILCHDLFNLIKDIIGKGTLLALHALPLVTILRQVSHHNRGILTSLCHLMQVNEDTWVASGEVHILREEHRRVAMGVERQGVMMHTLHLLELPCLVHQPLEDRQSVGTHTLRMPLHTQDRLELGTLNSLYHPIGSTADNTETRSGIAHRLMMEGVDIEREK